MENITHFDLMSPACILYNNVNNESKMMSDEELIFIKYLCMKRVCVFVFLVDCALHTVCISVALVSIILPVFII